MSARQLIRGYEARHYGTDKPSEVIIRIQPEAGMTVFAFRDTRRLWLPTKRLREILEVSSR